MTMNQRRSWYGKFGGGLLSGRDRGEPVSKFERAALLTQADRERWDLEYLERSGLPKLLRPHEDRIRNLEQAQSRHMYGSDRPRNRGGMDIPEGTR